MMEPAPVDFIKRRFTAGKQLGHVLAHIGIVDAAVGFAAGIRHARNGATGVRQAGRHAAQNYLFCTARSADRTRRRMGEYSALGAHGTAAFAHVK